MCRRNTAFSDALDSGCDPLPNKRFVRIEELPAPKFEAVLRFGQVADLGLDYSAVNGRQFAGSERVRGADEPWLIGVDDRSGPRPDLHPDQRLIEDAGLDDRIDARDRGRIPGEQGVREHGLY
jgi:hypothetical protein